MKYAPKWLSAKVEAKFLSTTFGYSEIRISRLDDPFAGIELGTSSIAGQQRQQKDEIKRKGEKPLIAAHTRGKNVMKRDSSGKRGILFCKCFFERVGANLAHIRAKNAQNAQKCIFFQKSPGANGLRTTIKLP